MFIGHPSSRGRRVSPSATRAVVACTLVAATIVVGGQSSALAAHGPTTSTWPANMARPAVPQCPQGEVPLIPTSGSTDSLGVSRFEYASMPGMVAIAPPKGLTTGNVTPALLTDLGLPTHPETGAKGREQAVREAVALSAEPNARAFCRGTSPAAPPVRSRASQGTSSAVAKAASGSAQFSHYFSYNWAGYGVTEAEYGTTANEVNGAWTVNGSHTSTQYQPSAEATWLGIGGGIGEGSSTWGLIQEGVAMRTNLGYQDWWEILGDTDNNACNTNPSCDPVYASYVTPGDSVNGEVFWNTQQVACFDFTDNTHPADSFYSCSGIPDGGIYDHTSAEWINESLVTEGYYQYYDDPGTTYWTNQSLGATFGGAAAVSSPFVYPFQAEVMLVPGTPYTNNGLPSPACSSAGVESFPANAVNNGSSGSSVIDTCPTGFNPGEDGN